MTYMVLLLAGPIFSLEITAADGHVSPVLGNCFSFIVDRISLNIPNSFQFSSLWEVLYFMAGGIAAS